MRTGETSRRTSAIESTESRKTAKVVEESMKLVKIKDVQHKNGRRYPAFVALASDESQEIMRDVHASEQEEALEIQDDEDGSDEEDHSWSWKLTTVRLVVLPFGAQSLLTAPNVSASQLARLSPSSHPWTTIFQSVRLLLCPRRFLETPSTPPPSLTSLPLKRAKTATVPRPRLQPPSPRSPPVLENFLKPRVQWHSQGRHSAQASGRIGATTSVDAGTEADGDAAVDADGATAAGDGHDHAELLAKWQAYALANLPL